MTSAPTDKSAKARVTMYFAALPPAARAHLTKLRQSIAAAIPDAEDGFSYNIPGYAVGGRMLVWYAGWKRHSSLYPVSDSVKRTYAAELAGYETSKGTVRFPHDKPPPTKLVRQLVRARLDEIQRSPKP